jgi:hypothetical protein
MNMLVEGKEKEKGLFRKVRMNKIFKKGELDDTGIGAILY